MKETKYPYDAWVLTSLYYPVIRTFVRGYDLYGVTETGKPYHKATEIFGDKGSAIVAAEWKLRADEEKLRKAQERLEKRRAAIATASFSI